MRLSPQIHHSCRTGVAGEVQRVFSAHRHPSIESDNHQIEDRQGPREHPLEIGQRKGAEVPQEVPQIVPQIRKDQGELLKGRVGFRRIGRWEEFPRWDKVSSLFDVRVFLSSCSGHVQNNTVHLMGPHAPATAHYARNLTYAPLWP